MRRYPCSKALVTALLLLCFAQLTFAEKPKMKDVAGKLSCYCGTCPHLVVTDCGCSTAEQIKQDIQKMIDQGMTEEQIIQSYVAQYGQTVLSAPPKSGFNLTAWVLPFLAFAVGGALLFTFLKRQQKEKQEEAIPDSSNEKADPKEARYRELLEKELEQRR